MPTSEPMAAALAEARSALGWMSPNPAVGGRSSCATARSSARATPSRRAATTPRSRRSPPRVAARAARPCSSPSSPVPTTAAPRGSTTSTGCRRRPSPASNHAMRRQGRGRSRHSPSCERGEQPGEACLALRGCGEQLAGPVAVTGAGDSGVLRDKRDAGGGGGGPSVTASGAAVLSGQFLGSPSPRVAMMLRWISELPPAMVCGTENTYSRVAQAAIGARESSSSQRFE